MGKQNVLYLALGLMFGSTLTMGVWLFKETQPDHAFVAHGQMGASNITIASGRLSGRGDADAIYIYDSETKKLAAYFISGKSLEVLAVRNTQFDWSFDEYYPKGGRQIPSVKDMKKLRDKRK